MNIYMTKNVKQACVSCHFFIQHNALVKNREIKSPQRAATQKQDFSWLNDEFALACYRGIWDEGIAPELKNKRNEIVDKERADICFFYNYTSGMSFQAAMDLQNRKVDKSSITYNIGGDLFNQSGDFQGANINIKSDLKNVT